jgi:hypothetical protein
MYEEKSYISSMTGGHCFKKLFSLSLIFKAIKLEHLLLEEPFQSGLILENST